MDADLQQSANDLDTAAAVGRAASLWIRRQTVAGELGLSSAATATQAYAAGVIIGLCDGLRLGRQMVELVAYVTAQLDGHGAGALNAARAMLAASSNPTAAMDVALGKAAARKLIGTVRESLRVPDSP